MPAHRPEISKRNSDDSFILGFEVHPPEGRACGPGFVRKAKRNPRRGNGFEGLILLFDPLGLLQCIDGWYVNGY